MTPERWRRIFPKDSKVGKSPNNFDAISSGKRMDFPCRFVSFTRKLTGLFEYHSAFGGGNSSTMDLVISWESKVPPPRNSRP